MSGLEFPVAYFERNMVLSQAGEVWFLYRLQPTHYEHLSGEARLALLWRTSRLFWNLEDCEGQLLIIPRLHHPLAQMNHLLGQLGGPMAEAAYQSYSEAAMALADGHMGVELDYVIALRPQAPENSFAKDSRSFLSSLWQEPRRAVERLLGLQTLTLTEYELAASFEREELVFQRLSRIVKAVRLDEFQIGGLIRRGFWRGIAEQPPNRTASRPDSLVEQGPDGTLLFRFDRTEMARLAEGEMDLSNPRRLKVAQETRGGVATGVAAFCYVSDLPDDLFFPGSEWLYSLQDLPFPVELCVRWRCLNHDAALGMVRRKKLEITDQDRHTRTAGEDIPLALLDAQEQASMLEHELKQRRFPTVLWSVCCIVTGESEREVHERIKQLKDHLSTYQIGLEVPAGDQLAAFMEAVPGGPQSVTDYVHRVPPEVAAGAMFLCTRAIGDHSGPFIGRTGVQQRPVYLDPTLGPKLNRSASIAFLGSLGGGKSFAANLLTYLGVVWRGAKALVLDPKGERSNWLYDLPELQGHLDVVTLSAADEDSGKLDPFMMLGAEFTEEERKETVNLAVSLISFLSNIPTGDDRFLAVMQAVNEVSRGAQPCLMKVIDRLTDLGQEMPQVATLAKYLSALSELAYANLIFGSGRGNGISLSKRVTVLQLQAVTMPAPGKPREEYSLEEVLSVALMHAVTAFATRFTRQDRDTFKIVLVDEAWALLASSQGRSLVSHLLRTGRAMNNAVYLVSQNVADLLDERIKNNLGVKFIFRSHDQDEISQVLEFMNLEPEDENIQAVRGLETGQALMQDLQGRVGVVTLDGVLPHVLRAFDTRPRALGGANVSDLAWSGVRSYEPGH